MNYIVTKPTKSKGIAILLVLLFGPVGLFYSSIRGGVIMLISPIIALLLFYGSSFTGNLGLGMASLSFLFIFTSLFWIICIIWAVNAVDKYNAELYKNSNNQNSPKTSPYEENPTEGNNIQESNIETQTPEVKFVDWIFIGLFLFGGLYAIYDLFIK